MLVECSRCGAPLDVPSGAKRAKCGYCEATNELRRTKTLAMQTPQGWQPPPQWQPPSHVPHDSNVVLTYHGTAAKAAGRGILPMVMLPIILVAIAGAVAAGVVFVQVDRAVDQVQSIPAMPAMPGIGGTTGTHWDGLSTLSCGLNGRVVIENQQAAVPVGAAIDAVGPNCHVTIRNSSLRGDPVISAGTNTRVEVENSTLEGSRIVTGGMNLQLTVSGTSRLVATGTAIDTQINPRITIHGPATVEAGDDAIVATMNAEVTLRDAVVTAGGTVFEGQHNPRLDASGGRIAGQTAAWDLGSNARVRVVGTEIEGAQNHPRRADVRVR